MTTRTKIVTWIETVWSGRPKLSKWKDYLQDFDSSNVQDENWDAIVIYSDSWFEEIPWTTWTKI